MSKPNSISSETLPVSKTNGLPLHTKILIGLCVGLFLGILSNVLAEQNPDYKENLKWIAGNIAYPVGQVFLRMIFMVIAPLIFTSLALGIYDLGDLKKIGRIGFKTLAFTVVITAIAVLTGALIIDLIQPGVGIEEAGKKSLMDLLSGDKQTSTILTKASEAKSTVQSILDIIPRNIFVEFTFFLDPSYKGGGLIAIMFFAIIFGVAMTQFPTERMEPLAKTLQGIYDVVMKIIEFAMKLAPLGVAALIFTTSSQLGFQVLVLLGKYVFAVILALCIHEFITYSLFLKYGAKRSPIEFFKNIREVLLTAFSTSSSSATLPTTLRVAYEKLKLKKDVSNFVLIVGASTNHNGTALFEGMTVLFLAQFYGVDLSFGQQVSVVLLAIVASIGTAGVPGGSLPLIVLLLQRVGVPAEGIGIILGVDRILDMSRTVVNVTGDLTVAALVDSSEKNSADETEIASKEIA